MGGMLDPRTPPSDRWLALALLLVLLAAPLGTVGRAEGTTSTPVHLATVTDSVVLTPADPRAVHLQDRAPEAADHLLEGKLAITGGLVHLVDDGERSLGIVETPGGPAWVTLGGGGLVAVGADQLPGIPADAIDEEHAAPVDKGALHAPTPGERDAETTGSADAGQDGTLQIFLDGDRAFWADHRGTWAEHQLAIAHLVDAIYQVNLGIDIEVVEQHIWPLVGDNPLTSNQLCEHPNLLRQFRDHWEATKPVVGHPWEAAHLFTGRGLQGTTIGCAYIGQLGTPWAYGVSQTLGGDSLANLYRDVVLTSHELGHNFDGRHGPATGGASCVGATIMWPTLCFNNPTFSGILGDATGVCPDPPGQPCLLDGNAHRMSAYASERI